MVNRYIKAIMHCLVHITDFFGNKQGGPPCKIDAGGIAFFVESVQDQRCICYFKCTRNLFNILVHEHNYTYAIKYLFYACQYTHTYTCTCVQVTTLHIMYMYIIPISHRYVRMKTVVHCFSRWGGMWLPIGPHLLESTQFLYPLHWRRYSSNNGQVVTDLQLESLALLWSFLSLSLLDKRLSSSPNVQGLHP